MNVKVLIKNILVTNDGRILVLKRSTTDKRRPNCWDFPGGNLEEGEDVYKAAEREIKEETGLIAKNLRVVYIESGINTGDLNVLALCFATKDFYGDITLSSEHCEHLWITSEEFLEMETGDDGGFLHNCLSFGLMNFVDPLR